MPVKHTHTHSSTVFLKVDADISFWPHAPSKTFQPLISPHQSVFSGPSSRGARAGSAAAGFIGEPSPQCSVIDMS